MKGLYTAVLLQLLIERFIGNNEHASDFDLGKKFNLICGTSTGAILGIALAAGIPLTSIVKLYQKKGPEIFPHPMPNGTSKKILWAIRNALKSPAATQGELKKALAELLKDETLGEMYARREIAICAPSVWASRRAPRVFKTGHINGKNMDDDQTLVEVCLASASAPILFPIHQHKNRRQGDVLEQYVDGGLWANNPVLIALTEAVQMVEKDTPIQILSVGTPTLKFKENIHKLDRGIVHWHFGNAVLDMSMNAQSLGHNNTAIFLAKTFSSLGWSIEIHRIKEDLSSRDMNPKNHIELDSSYKSALEILREMASQDSIFNHSSLLASGDSSAAWVKNIFGYKT